MDNTIVFGKMNEDEFRRFEDKNIKDYAQTLIKGRGFDEKTALTESEKELFRRARNAHSRTPRASTVREYHISTGFEALLGILYLKKENDRLREISEAAFQAIAKQMMKG